MSDTVEQVKARLDIAEVISGYLKLQKAGANYKARCPFHNEKTPSFHVSPQRQSWHCFGCNKGGDMLSFVQEIEGIDFIEALRILATKANVPMDERRGASSPERSHRQALLAVADLSAKFFETQLWQSTAGKRALEYLRERGLTDDTIRAWRLGWAPNDWRALSGFLQKQGYPAEHIVGAGMAIQKNRPESLYDRFRSRIMFPICDVNGQVVGFTGRVFGAEVAVDGEPLAKYVNTPQTDVYDKGRILFGLDKARIAMRTRDAALLVEGNMDAILSWQAGVQHVVATSGTALTPHQLKLLSRYTMNADVCFDADTAGKAATRRGIALALAQNFSVRILTIRDPECKDPADYVRKHGAGWGDVVATAVPALQYYYNEAVAAFDPSSVRGKKAIVTSLAPLIRRLPSRVEQGHWVGQLATLLRASQAAVEADVAAAPDDLSVPDQHEESPQAAPAQNLQPLDTTGQELLALFVRMPRLVPQATEIADLLDPRVSAVVADPTMLDTTYQGEHRHLIDVAVIRSDQLWQHYNEQQLQEEFNVLVNRLRERRIRERRADVERDIRQAEAAKDGPRLQELLATFQQYTAELHRLQSIRSPNTT
ncbi:MAG: DNA primase [Candidatus Yanofskybacteria bacterium]|nr:DNA primase [Candidatus Yanofskybacteria bacterium]